MIVGEVFNILVPAKYLSHTSLLLHGLYHDLHKVVITKSGWVYVKLMWEIKVKQCFQGIYRIILTILAAVIVFIILYKSTIMYFYSLVILSAAMNLKMEVMFNEKLRIKFILRMLMNM